MTVSATILKAILERRVKDWIKVKAWKPDPNEWDNGVLYSTLLEHHRKETTYLIEMVEELADELEAWRATTCEYCGDTIGDAEVVHRKCPPDPFCECGRSEVAGFCSVCDLKY